jgi:MOSC domain-containing protein YiiM
MTRSPVAASVVLSVNVGAVREVASRGRMVRTGIWKTPVDGPVLVRGVNLAGDDQADRSVHGGADKAVYAYAVEDYAFWGEREVFPVHAGVFGENLTVQGLDLGRAAIGERWQVGTTVLEVAQPRLPCFKLGIRVGDATFLKRFQAAIRPGAYLRIIQEGTLAAGDSVRVLTRPDHGVTIALMAESVTDAVKARAIQAAPQLPAGWRDA